MQRQHLQLKYRLHFPEAFLIKAKFLAVFKAFLFSIIMILQFFQIWRRYCNLNKILRRLQSQKKLKELNFDAQNYQLFAINYQLFRRLCLKHSE